MAQYQGEVYVNTETDQFVLKGRPCELSSYSFLPTDRYIPKERTVFNSDKKDRYTHSTYDRLFHQTDEYNNKLHRDDREHAKSRGLTVNAEEITKGVPTLSSSVYGHPQLPEIDPPSRHHVRIGHVKTDFYRRNNINIKPPQTLADF